MPLARTDLTGGRTIFDIQRSMAAMNASETTQTKIVAFPEELITKKELAKRLKLCVRTVELQTNQGAIPVIRIGTAVRYSWPDVFKALTEHETRQASQPASPTAA